MRHRIHTPHPFQEAELVDITGDEFHHAARVARVKEGEEVELFDGRGKAARGVVTALQRDRMRVRVDAEISARESSIDITLAMSIIQLDKFELVLQKGTELGVRSFIPMITARAEVRPERYRGKQERWEKIVFEAVKQSGRAVIPLLELPQEFANVIVRPGLKIIFDADQKPGRLPEPLAAAALLVGPEGGFDDDEIVAARGAGCVFQRLGPRRLRAETAAIVAAARYGDI